MQLVVGRSRGRTGSAASCRWRCTPTSRTPGSRLARVLVTEPAARGPLTVSSVRWHSGRLLVSFAGYRRPDQAEDLRGTLLVMDSAEVAPAEDPDEFNDYELIGLDVADLGRARGPGHGCPALRAGPARHRARARQIRGRA